MPRPPSPVRSATRPRGSQFSTSHSRGGTTLDQSRTTARGAPGSYVASLATLEGTIDTNTFSGTKATGIADIHGLDSDGTFTGSFTGGFYGSKAAEAAGVFDFTSEAAEDGAFRGAFGADRNPE